MTNSSNQNKLYSYMKESESESSGSESSDDDLVQIGDEDADHSMEFYSAADNGMTPMGIEYNRVLPSQFDEDSPNNFMRHVITDYALEKKTKEGKPSGEFLMDKRQTMNLSKE